MNEAEARLRLFEAVTRLVLELASRQPVVLFLDDLPWADAASLDLLSYALRRWTDVGAAPPLACRRALRRPRSAAGFRTDARAVVEHSQPRNRFRARDPSPSRSRSDKPTASVIWHSR